MNANQLTNLCTLLNIGIITTAPKKVTGGLLHTMWHVKTSTGGYAIKELNPSIMAKKQASNAYDITEKIAQTFAKKGVATAISIQHNNHSVIEINGTFFIVYYWVTGTTLPNSFISLPYAQEIGALLATLHNLNIQVSVPAAEWYTHSDEYYNDLIERGLQSNLPFVKSLKIIQEHVFVWNQRYQEAISQLKKNVVISHGDIDQKNVIWDNNLQPILIDWESARLLNPTHEIIHAAFDWSGLPVGHINIGVFKAVIQAYKEAGGIIKDEDLKAVFLGIPGDWLAWFAYNLERALNGTLSDQERQLGIEQVQQTKILPFLKQDPDQLIAIIQSLL